ncbi:hypothetical protein HAX54_044050 [Datura stramonium]|uniref:Uncharacterized protein n=1 Tax=Datura stramonium TaxID=4076 RepID=A0ABS8W5F0_DATST|nr:hypothetical protein [Datura stramonium]
MSRRSGLAKCKLRRRYGLRLQATAHNLRFACEMQVRTGEMQADKGKEPCTSKSKGKGKAKEIPAPLIPGMPSYIVCLT